MSNFVRLDNYYREHKIKINDCTANIYQYKTIHRQTANNSSTSIHFKAKLPKEGFFSRLLTKLVNFTDEAEPFINTTTASAKPNKNQNTQTTSEALKNEVYIPLFKIEPTKINSLYDKEKLNLMYDYFYRCVGCSIRAVKDKPE